MVRSGDMADRAAERAPYRWAALAAAVAVSVSPKALAQTPPPSPTPPPATTPNSATQGLPVLLEADQLIDDDANKTITAQGDVEIRYEGRTMRADTVVYNLNAGTVHATGDVEIVAEDGSTTYADEIETDDKLNIGVATEVRARLGGSGTLAARAVLRHGPGQSELRNVIYTSCPICEGGNRPPTWSLRARRAIQDRNAHTILYSGAVLDVAGVPILYLPFFGNPDPSVGRASGLLTPEIGRTSYLGAFFDQPYYWAISPYSDLTASLRLHQNVNPILGLEFRKRFFSGQFDIATTVTQEQLFDTDGHTFGEDRVRGGVFGKGLFRLTDYWQWGFGVERTYDDFYLRRYNLTGPGENRGPYIGTRTRLISQLYAIGQDDHSYSQISFVSFQGLRSTETSDLLPAILPAVDLEQVLYDPLVHGQARLQVNGVALTRNDNPATPTFEGNDGRLTGSVTWQKDWVVGPGVVVSPFAQARGDYYQIETSSGHYESVSRGLGLAGVQASWPFMRPGESFDLIVEPVVMAAYASQAAADPRIVNEDGLGFQLDDSDLFRPNGAPNYDLWEPGGRVSAGVRMTARANSGQSASLIFGRRWRDQVAPQFPESSNLHEQASNWVGAVQADLGHNLGVDARFILDDRNLNIDRLDLGVRASVGLFSGSARYFSINDTFSPGDPQHELDANVSVQLARGWRAQFGVVRDLDSDTNLRQEISAIYEDDCTFLEIAYTRSETQAGTIGPSEGVQIRVGLRSLGVIGGS
ncbi:MAG: LPS-assembly protein LptD [Proteobacteria bacterium]|nr:LPS-assembly protein LptD [Pseudomonadota bacterium]